MPLYEYECENCGRRFERLQSINAEPVRQCPECAGVVHKVFHAAGIIFKGSGWYITDSRKAASGTVTGDSKQSNVETKKPDPGTKTETQGESKSDGPSAAKADSKSEGKSDGKSENKSESKSESK
jgi:putative FmdB family regulatory protein